ncbi:MAG: hypothetical protein NT062_30655 [Proteobacteria bacterium]|nr:hypothetical protein [Pseudomonadota bacterium]
MATPTSAPVAHPLGCASVPLPRHKLRSDRTDLLTELIDGWVSLAQLTPFRDLQEQAPPWASISQGAAGNAYALWHIAKRRSQPSVLVGAQRWWRFAVRAAERRSGFRSAAFNRIPITASVPFGRPGLHVVETLLDHERAKPTRSGLTKLAASLRRKATTPSEFMAGQAGGLTAALHVARWTDAPEMREVADTLAGRLLDAPAMPVNGFAHGQVGVQHALLTWFEHTRTPPPANLVAQLVSPTDAEIIARVPTLAGSWCNGLPGFVMLWVKAYELTGDPAWRDRAREAVHTLATLPSTSGSLCCGAGGHAYALLALARIDASEDWHSTALTLCTRGLSQVADHGVFRGLPGLVCLAVDLITPGTPRFPLVEA